MRYVFAECVLDTQLYTLHRAGTAMRLRPKAFRVLQYLLEHRDRVVSKDELCAHVWPGQFISKATLEGCITLARQAIGDSGREQRLIQSRRGYGYRFVGAVEEWSTISSAPAEVSRASAAAADQEPVPGQLDSARLPDAPGPLVADAAPSWSASSPRAEAPARRPAQPVGEGGRKLVTLLCCTLLLAAGDAVLVDLEEVHRRMRMLYACVRQASQQYGGTIQQVAGDRLLVVFGAPLPRKTTPSGPSWPPWGCTSA